MRRYSQSEIIALKLERFRGNQFLFHNNQLYSYLRTLCWNSQKWLKTQIWRQPSLKIMSIENWQIFRFYKHKNYRKTWLRSYGQLCHPCSTWYLIPICFLWIIKFRIFSPINQHIQIPCCFLWTILSLIFPITCRLHLSQAFQAESEIFWSRRGQLRALVLWGLKRVII